MLLQRSENTQVTLNPSGVVIADVVLNHLDQRLLTGKTPSIISFSF